MWIKAPESADHLHLAPWPGPPVSEQPFLALVPENREPETELGADLQCVCAVAWAGRLPSYRRLSGCGGLSAQESASPSAGRWASYDLLRGKPGSRGLPGFVMGEVVLLCQSWLTKGAQSGRHPCALSSRGKAPGYKGDTRTVSLLM